MKGLISCDFLAPRVYRSVPFVHCLPPARAQLGGMIDVLNKRCLEKGCRRQPSWAKASGARALFCKVRVLYILFRQRCIIMILLYDTVFGAMRFLGVCLNHASTNSAFYEFGGFFLPGRRARHTPSLDQIHIHSPTSSTMTKSSVSNA